MISNKKHLLENLSFTYKLEACVYIKTPPQFLVELVGSEFSPKYYFLRNIFSILRVYP